MVEIFSIWSSNYHISSAKKQQQQEKQKKNEWSKWLKGCQPYINSIIFRHVCVCVFVFLDYIYVPFSFEFIKAMTWNQFIFHHSFFSALSPNIASKHAVALILFCFISHSQSISIRNLFRSVILFFIMPFRMLLFAHSPKK